MLPKEAVPLLILWVRLLFDAGSRKLLDGFDHLAEREYQAMQVGRVVVHDVPFRATAGGTPMLAVAHRPLLSVKNPR